MPNKKIIILIALVLASVLLLVLAVFAIRAGIGTGDSEGDTIFGNTTTVRDPPPEPDEAEIDVRGGASYWGEGSDTKGVPVLRMLSKEPVAGAVGVLVEPPEYAPEEYVRFVERSSGHVKDVPLARVEDPSVVRSDTMLRIGRVYWSPNGTTTLLQRLDADGGKIYSYVTTFGLLFAPPATTTGTSTEEVAPTTTNGRHLEFDAVVTAAISPDARSLFYIVRTEAGSVGYIESIVLGTRREVWQSPLSSVTARWDAPGTIVIYTNPASDMTGHLWLLDPVTGVATLALGDEYALAARMNPTGTQLLYSLQEKMSGITSLRVLTLGTDAVAFLPPVMSAPVEKCAWGTRYPELVYCAVPRNLSTLNYLENWYLGALASDDVLWQVNTTTGEAHMILDPVELTTFSFDIIDLEVSPSGGFLVFRTKSDDRLWATTIPQERLPLPGEEMIETSPETSL